MRDIVTAQEMKDLDRNTIENAGVLSLVLMERAALKTVEEMKKLISYFFSLFYFCLTFRTSTIFINL